jgi:octaprenyl-diphosphate synthase
MTPRLRALPSALRQNGLARRVEALTGDKLAAVDVALARYLHSPFIPVAEMGTYLAASRGKRIRPTLLLLASRMLGYMGEKDVTYSAIFELVHTASLIHDDIVDQTLLRRGRASLNARYGSEMAVLMGDYVFTLALNLANREGTGPVLTVISETTLNLVQGELLQSHHKYDLTLSMKDYLEILRCKTAQLFSACAQTPALMVDAPEEQRLALAEFGKKIGLAFQIVDDCLDFNSDEVTLGKPVCNDLKEGKITLPILLLLERGTTQDRAFLDAVVGARRFDSDTLQEVVGRCRRAGTIRAAEEMAEAYTRGALQCLERLPEGEVRDLLSRLPEIVLHRKF